LLRLLLRFLLHFPGKTWSVSDEQAGARWIIRHIALHVVESGRKVLLEKVTMKTSHDS